MSIQNEKFIDVDLKKGTLFRSFALNLLGDGDISGDRLGVRIFDNGEPADLSGTECVCLFIRPDGITLLLEGTVSGNTAYIDLPQAAYAKAGQIKLTIKLMNANGMNSVCMIDGTVVDTTTGEVSDTAEVIPSLADFMSEITRAEDAIDAINALTVEAVQIEGTRYAIEVTKEE